jgi:hypothetical protein
MQTTKTAHNAVLPQHGKPQVKERRAEGRRIQVQTTGGVTLCGMQVEAQKQHSGPRRQHTQAHIAKIHRNNSKALNNSLPGVENMADRPEGNTSEAHLHTMQQQAGQPGEHSNTHPNRQSSAQQYAVVSKMAVHEGDDAL